MKTWSNRLVVVNESRQQMWPIFFLNRWNDGLERIATKSRLDLKLSASETNFALNLVILGTFRRGKKIQQFGC
jgi:hypothetical protein